MLLVQLLQRVEDDRSGFTVLVGQVEEVDHFADGGVLHHDHVF